MPAFLISPDSDMKSAQVFGEVQPCCLNSLPEYHRPKTVYTYCRVTNLPPMVPSSTVPGIRVSRTFLVGTSSGLEASTPSGLSADVAVGLEVELSLPLPLDAHALSRPADGTATRPSAAVRLTRSRRFISDPMLKSSPSPGLMRCSGIRRRP